MKNKRKNTLLAGLLLSALTVPLTVNYASAENGSLGENSAYTLQEVGVAGTNTITKYVYDETSGLQEKFYQLDLKKKEYGTGNTTATYTLDTPPVKDVSITAKYDAIDTASSEYTTKYDNQINDLGTVTDPVKEKGVHYVVTGGILNNQNIDNALFSLSGSKINIEKTNISPDPTISYVDFYGGAVNNSSVLTAIKADFINNSTAITSSGSYAVRVFGNIYGGALYNSGTITDVAGNFIENSVSNATNGYTGSAYTYGGAIANTGTITNIKGDFIRNSASSSKTYTPTYGGAIYNAEKAVIETIEGNFIENSITNTAGRSYSYGGAIANAGTITNVKGNFIKNSVSAGSTNAHGGAIYNTSKGTIETIIGDFIGNSATSTSSSHGGALYNQGAITSIASNFIDNSAILTGTSGYAYGGAIYNSKTIGSITGDFIGNRADATKASNTNGGAIYNSGTITTLNGDFIANSVTNNNGNAYGGAIFNSKTIESIKGNFIGNSATSSNKESVGGAIYNDKAGAITVSDSSFEGNKAYHAGAINNNGGELTVNDTTFTANIADGRGGAIYSYNSSKSEPSTVTVNNSIFTANEATWGGALFTANGTFTITNTDFIANKANTDSTTAYGGGAIFNDMDVSTLSITGGDFIQNSSGFRGGAIHNTGKMDITGATFEGNTAVDAGGAIMTAGTQDVLTDVKFIGNTVTAGDGGAVYQAHHDSQDPSLTITNGLFQDNTAQGAGGALVAMRALSIEGTQFEGNKTTTDSTSGGGGAIFLGASSTTGIENSSIQKAQFIGNTSASNGGAIATREFENGDNENASLDIVNAKFDNNKATGTIKQGSIQVTGNGGAIYNTFFNSTNKAGFVYVGGADTEFTNNSAINGGAIYNATYTEKDGTVEYGSIYIDGAKFANNNATSGGGAIYSAGKLTVDNAIFENNKASFYGGAINTGTSTADMTTITNSTFTNNTSDYDGGAIGHYSKAGLDIKGSTFTGNKANVAGEAGNYTQANADDAALGGGAIAFGSLATASINSITDTTFDGNISGSYGGAIATRHAVNGNGKKNDNSNGKLNINATFKNNVAVKDGGAIYNSFYNNNDGSDSVSVSGTFENNTAYNNGGAIFNDGTADKNGNGGVMTVKDSTFTGNTATNGKGGAIYNTGDMYLKGTNEFKTATDDIFNAGTLTIADGETTLNAALAGTETSTNTVASGATLNIGLNNLQVALANEGTLNLSGSGTVSNALTGNGTTAIEAGAIIQSAQNIQTAISLANNATLQFSEATPVLKAVTSDNGVLDLQGNTTALTLASLDGSANLKLDWGDTFDVTDTANSNISEVIIGSLDMTGVTFTAGQDKANYTFTTSVGDKVALGADAEFINLERGKAVIYESAGTSGELTYQVANNLQIFAGEVGEITGPPISATYAMDGSETFGESAAFAGDANITINYGDTLTIVGPGTEDVSVNGGINVANGTVKLNDVDVNPITDPDTSAPTEITLSGAGTSELQVNSANREMEINSNITSTDVSNMLVFSGSNTITTTGEFDPFTALVNMATPTTEVVRANKDSEINWILQSGTLKYLNDSYLSNTAKLNSIEFKGGNLDVRNGVATDIKLADLSVTADSNIYADVDLTNQKMDNLSANTYTTLTNNLTLKEVNVFGTPTAESFTIDFTDATLNGNVSVDSSVIDSMSAITTPIYNYTVNYITGATGGGQFEFTAASGASAYNPAIMASSVAAQLGGYLTQLNSYDEAFRNMDMYMLMTKAQRQAIKNANKYAAADSSLVFDPINTPYTDKAGWFRPYANFESVGLKNGPKVSNVMYGTFAGLESELVELGNGWDGMMSIYAGYNGSHQAYQGNSIYQNGGTLGLVGMAYKDNFFTGLTANVGANIADASTMYGSEDFSMLMTGIASKTGYNFEFADGKFIIQPSYLMSYSMVNTFDYTNAAGVRINSDPLHAIQIEPGLKFIGNLKNGWQPYAGVSVVFNIMDDTKFNANDVSLPELSVKPYAKYGVGVRKTWGERLVGFFQTFLTSGGRNGVGIQGGFRWTLGNDKAPKKANSTGEKKIIKAKV